MTTTSPELACRHLESLWPAPARFVVTGAGGEPLAGDPALAARAVAALAGVPQAARVVWDGPLVVVRAGAGEAVLAADVPRAALPGLLEADLLRLTSARA